MGGQKSLSRRADEFFLLLLLLVNWRQLSPRATPFRLPPAILFRGDCTGRFRDLTRSSPFAMPASRHNSHISESRMRAVGHQLEDDVVKADLNIISFWGSIKIVCRQDKCQVIYA